MTDARTTQTPIPGYLNVSDELRELATAAEAAFDAWDDAELAHDEIRDSIDAAKAKDVAALREAVANGTDYPGEVHERAVHHATTVAAERVRITRQAAIDAQRRLDRATGAEMQAIIPQITGRIRDAWTAHVELLEGQAREAVASKDGLNTLLSDIAFIARAVAPVRRFGVGHITEDPDAKRVAKDLRVRGSKLSELMNELERMASEPNEIEQAKLGFKPAALATSGAPKTKSSK